MPGVDELGLPVWPHGCHDITRSRIRSVWMMMSVINDRQYRRRCLTVHPDKNSGERARHAFQLLNEAYKALLDEDQRVSIAELWMGSLDGVCLRDRVRF